MIALITFPEIDPIAIQLGPLAIRWYALAYIVGLLLGWKYCVWLTRFPPKLISRASMDDFLFWATIGVVIGGRLGYVLFYKPGYYITAPHEIFFIWQGGMSFHGGLIGVLVAIGIYARRLGVHYFSLADIVGAAVPIGLFFGRIANFVNGELFGKPTDLAWAMVFPHGGPEPRHPSQLYEAGLEGLVLFLLLFVLIRRGALEKTGFISGCFLIGYGTARFLVEYAREPDQHLAEMAQVISMGQVLSLPMILAGLVILLWSRKRAAARL